MELGGTAPRLCGLDSLTPVSAGRRDRRDGRLPLAGSRPAGRWIGHVLSVRQLRTQRRSISCSSAAAPGAHDACRPAGDLGRPLELPRLDTNVPGRRRPPARTPGT
jgi:hypothetical protein